MKTLVIVLLSTLVELSGATNEPTKKFSDDMLASLWQAKYVEGLGKVIGLDTYLSPKDVSLLKTNFSIVTGQHSTFGITYNKETNHPYDLDRLASSGFNASAKTVVMMAGYLSDGIVSWIKKAQFLWSQLEPGTNFIHVDWTTGNRYIYSTAVADTPLIARQITILLYYLYSLHGNGTQVLKEPEVAKRIHFVGHSLGAHIGGFVGQDFGGKLGRITGLDPAGPSFDKMNKHQRLSRDDALLVDIIHTNSGQIKYLKAFLNAPFSFMGRLCNYVPLVRNLTQSIGSWYSSQQPDTAWFGINQNIGHIDYYANDGSRQPGCAGDFHDCDHGRATSILVDILKYERDVLTTNEARKTNRLLAFNANSYESFRIGENFDQNCQKIMQFGEHLGEQVSKSLSSCSIPIDLISPVDELIDELRNNHHFNPTEGMADKFYFKTNDGNSDNLIGNHFLLKLHLDGHNFDHIGDCDIQFELSFNNGHRLMMEFNSLFKYPSWFDQKVWALPFIGPDVKKTHRILNKNLIEGNDTLVDWSMNYMGSIFPQVITISLRSKGMIEHTTSMAKRFIKWIKRDNRQSLPSQCQIRFSTVEIHPIFERKRNIAAIYNSQSKRESIIANKRHDQIIEQKSELTIGSVDRFMTEILL